MYVGLTLSLTAHVVLLGWALISFQATPPLKIPEPEPVEVGYKPGSYAAVLDHASVWSRDAEDREMDLYRAMEAAEQARKADWRQGWQPGLGLRERRV